jgi:hypothetical protein
MTPAMKPSYDARFRKSIPHPRGVALGSQYTGGAERREGAERYPGCLNNRFHRIRNGRVATLI